MLLKEYAKFLYEDIKIRKVLDEQLANAGISKIEIERTADEIKVDVFTSKPGVVIGKRGTNINDIKINDSEGSKQKYTVKYHRG